MNGAAEKYRKHSDHCLAMAAVAPDERVRASLLNLARLCEREARLVASAQAHLSESRELLLKADALLVQQRRVAVPIPPPDRHLPPLMGKV